ncbi:MAG TPA: hypothetical protein VIH59_09585 [Candidatus Tectomicrobia bacterium]|jgi:hypothetical protein
MQQRHPAASAEGGAFGGAFQKVTTARYELIRDLHATAKQLAAQQ